jgi:hypothetical protein
MTHVATDLSRRLFAAGNSAPSDSVISSFLQRFQAKSTVPETPQNENHSETQSVNGDQNAQEE